MNVNLEYTITTNILLLQYTITKLFENELISNFILYTLYFMFYFLCFMYLIG